jgi:Cu2+-exporting ATPase
MGISRAESVSFAEAEQPHAAQRATCVHCGLDVPSGMIDADTTPQFCCGGCRAAYAILHEHGLERYYEFGEQRGVPVRTTGRSYEEFDHPAFHALYVKTRPDGLAEVELYLEGVHCASCVWLVERVPLVVSGVASTELEIRRAMARVIWDPAVVPLSEVARSLDSLGYPPHPFRGVARDAIRRREDRAMLTRIGVAGAIAVNTMLAALALYSGWFGGMEPEYERFFRWISFALVTPALLWPGRVFFSSALAALRARTLHMDVPIALALSAGYVQGAINTVRDSGPVYFDGLAMLIFLLLVGRYLQQRGQRAAADSAELLYSLTPSTAHVVEPDGSIRELPPQALMPGMVVDVRAGDSLGADGVIVSGDTQIDSSLLTGESRPVAARTGERVFAGTVNIAAPIRVRVEESGETSRVAKIMRQVEESARRRAPVVATANRIAGHFVAAVLVLAAVTFVAWWFADSSRAVDNAIALLIVTCPCALALSTPLAVSVAIGRAARAGVFVKGGDALEQLATPGRLFLDKTGTITEARTALVAWNGADWVRPLILALEEGSSHPIAAAFRTAWPDLATPPIRDSVHVMGSGIEGRVDGRVVLVGSPAFVRPRARGIVPAIDAALTPVLVAVDGEIVAVAGIGDPVRVDAAAAIARLRSSGWSISILSGDAPSVVRTVGEHVGIPAECCTGGASPEAKRQAIEQARTNGPVVMVGDGINDAAAIAAASVGVGVHGGAEACLASADVYLTTPGLSSLVQLSEGAGRTMRVIRRNLAFSLVYNVIGAGLAIGGHLTPLVAAILMPASSLTVVIASWRSRTFDEART